MYIQMTTIKRTFAEKMLVKQVFGAVMFKRRGETVTARRLHPESTTTLRLRTEERRGGRERERERERETDRQRGYCSKD